MTATSQTLAQNHRYLIVSNRNHAHNVTMTAHLPHSRDRSHPTFEIVLHQPEIPQNTGNIGRTCVAAQARLWLVRPLGFQMNDRVMKRAGLDYWPHLNVEVAANWDELVAQVPTERHWYFTRFAERSIWSIDFTLGDALVFGSESSGLPSTICEPGDKRAIRIPTTEEIRSLNLSNAVAVALYEALRQTKP